MIALYVLLFLVPFALVPFLCAWMYRRKNWLGHFSSYALNAGILFVFPWIWRFFQDPVEISNQVPIISSASIFFLSNLIFGIPTALINQFLFDYLLFPRKKAEAIPESLPATS